MSDPVRVVVVGVGSFGRLHARTLTGLAEAELVGVVDRNPKAVEGLGLGAPRAWDSVEKALGESSAEAFVVATRTDSHVAIAEILLKAGKAVLVEKPLASDVASAARLKPLVKPDSSNLMMGHIVLFAPEFWRLQKEAEQRGPIVHFHAFRHRPAKTMEQYPEETPLRLIMVHDLYLALALTGGEAPEGMSARMHRTESGACDLVLAEMRWPGGTWGSFTSSFLTPGGMPADGFDRFEVFGEGWAARLSLNPQPFELWSQRAEWPIGLDIDDDPARPSGWMAEELRHFCRVVRGKARAPVGARYEDALMIQEWMQRLEESAAEE